MRAVSGAATADTAVVAGSTVLLRLLLQLLAADNDAVSLLLR